MEKQFKCVKCGNQYDYVRKEGCVICPGAKSIVRNSNYNPYAKPKNSNKL